MCPVAERQWQVEVALPKEAIEPIALVLALPAPQPIKVRMGTSLLPVPPLASLGQSILWGVPLVLEPKEPMQLVMQAL